MKVATLPQPNVVKDMLSERKSLLEQQAQELRDQREALLKAQVFWEQVASLCETPGWANFMEMVDAEIKKLHDTIEQPMEEHVTNHLRGSLKTLRWLSQVPALSAAMQQGVKQQMDAHTALETQFVETGAV